MASFTGFEHCVRQAEPLSRYTWFGLGGPAEYFAEPTSRDELVALVRRCRDEDVPVRVLGGGSNLLISDEGVPGMVVHLSASCFGEISTKGTTIQAGGGAKLSLVVSTSVREGLAGMEPLVGIPGTIGGALHGNAGSRGGDIGQCTVGATVLTAQGEIITRSRNDLVFAYRESSLDELVILEAQFQLDSDNPEELTKRMQKQWIVKKSSQPLGHQSAGCIFKNPQGMSAGQLIDEAGLKGTRVGGAEVSDRHANFIVVDPKSSSKDVLALIDLVRQRVSDRFGVDLETEIVVW